MKPNTIIGTCADCGGNITTGMGERPYCLNCYAEPGNAAAEPRGRVTVTRVYADISDAVH